MNNSKEYKRIVATYNPNKWTYITKSSGGKRYPEALVYLKRREIREANQTTCF